MKRLTWPVTIATVVGLIIAFWMIGLVGLHRLAEVVATAGIGGFALFLASYGVVLIALGAAWATSMRGEPRHSTWIFVSARAVREAAADLLPFSQIGGLMFGLQVVLRSGIAPARAYAATIVDLTTEMVAQLLLVLMGLAVFFYTLGGTRSGSDLARITWAGLAVMVALTGCLVFLQRPALRLMAGLSMKLVPAAREMIEVVHAELTEFARTPAASMWPASCNLVACLLSVFSAWIGFDVLGTHVSIGKVLALEALIYTLRSGAFLVPGALGIQEAGYVLLAPLLGIDREAALALSMLKRARDIVVGAPTLLVWRATPRRN